MKMAGFGSGLSISANSLLFLCFYAVFKVRYVNAKALILHFFFEF